jgi:signal transduction histidine kinase
MLAYSGKGHFIIEPLNINNILNKMNLIFKSVISKNIILNMNLAKKLLSINADVTQIQQVIMNLISNAAEAIGDKSGFITISTGVIQINSQDFDETITENALPKGNYVYLEINDTGCGMDKETKNRIFEPFFSTKFTGRGLGLAAVLGVIRGHKGYMQIHSEQNNGTSIKVFFPCVPDVNVIPEKKRKKRKL